MSVEVTPHTAHETHEVSMGIYYTIYTILMVLLVATVAVSRLNLGALALAVAMLPHQGPFAMVGIIVATQLVAFVLGAIAVRLPIPTLVESVGWRAPAPTPAEGH